MKGKSNWALGITIFYSAFALFMIGFLLWSSVQRVDLVAPNYYDQEIRYQDHIDKVRRSHDLAEGPQWDQEQGRLNLRFPSAMKGKRISGALTLYRPSNAGFDVKVPIAPDAALGQSISLAHLAKGLWRIKLDWMADSVSYYHEDNLTVR